MDKPRVSVIIPVYNGEKMIEACIRSVFAQKMTDMEIIAVDDGSRDRTGVLLDRLAAEDRRLKVIHQENAGAAAARNRGLEESRGEYIRFVDADDRLLENGIQPMVEVMEKENCQLVIGAYIQLLCGKRQQKNLYGPDAAVQAEDALRHMNPRSNSFYYGVLWNKLFRGDIIRQKKIRFRKELKLAEDFTFVCHYMCYVERVYYLSEAVYEYYRNGSGLTMQHCMDCVKHPLANCKLKKFLYDQLKHLYVEKGVYPRYRRTLWLYLFRITLTN